MTNYREIVTKAIIGKNKKSIKTDYEFAVNDNPNTILGCWIINNTFKGHLNGNTAIINGTFDINVWYSYDNDTKTGVYTENFSYNDTIKMNIDNLSGSEEVIVKCLKQPTVTDVKIENNLVKLKVEKDFSIEVVGNTTVRVAAVDDTLDYEEVYDTPSEDELNINNDNIDENYISVNK